MSTDDASPHEGLTDDQLDALLADTDRELLDLIQAHTDPTAALNVITTTSTPAAGALDRVGRADPADQDRVILVIQIRCTVRDLVRALSLDRVLDRGLARALGRGLALALDRAHALALHRARDNVLAFAHAHALVLDLDRVLDHALDNVLDLDRVLGRARDLDHALGLVQVDASAVDLSGLQIDDIEVLDGVAWDDRTIWPLHVVDQVRSRSVEVRPGLYRVRGGTERDPAEPART